MAVFAFGWAIAGVLLVALDVWARLTGRTRGVTVASAAIWVFSIAAVVFALYWLQR